MMSELETPAAWPPLAFTATEERHLDVEAAITDLAAETSRTASRCGLASRDWADLIKPFGFALRSLDHGDISGAGQNLLVFIHVMVLKAPALCEAESVALITAAERIHSQLARLESHAPAAERPA